VALNHLVEATTQENKGLSANDLAALLNDEPSKAQKVWASKTVKRFEEIGLAHSKVSEAQGPRYKQNLYKASVWAVSKHVLVF